MDPEFSIGLFGWDSSPLREQLQRLRVQRGWSQRDLAARTGIHQPDISRIEVGAVTPTESTLERLASSLGYRLALVPARSTEGLSEAPDERSAEGWQERIWRNPDTRNGQPAIRGMRISVRDVLEYLAGGMTPDEIIADFPELHLDDIRAALKYAAIHLDPLPL